MPERLHGIRHVAVILDRKPPPHARHSQRGFLPQGPMDQIEIVDAVIRDLAAAVVEEPTELIKPAIPIVRHLPRRPQPCFPVHAGRGRAVGRIADALGPFVLNMEGAHSRDLAQSATADILRHLAKHGRRAPVQTRLTNPLIPLYRLNHRPPLGDAQRDRLLDIYIFPGLAGMDGLQRMPVIGRGDDHRIHVLQFKQLAVVFESFRAGANLPGGKIKIRLVDVANGHDFRIALLQEGVQHLVAAVAHANEAQPHTVVGAKYAEGRKGRRRADRGKGPGKLPAGDWFHKSRVRHSLRLMVGADGNHSIRKNTIS